MRHIFVLIFRKKMDNLQKYRFIVMDIKYSYGLCALSRPDMLQIINMSQAYPQLHISFGSRAQCPLNNVPAKISPTKMSPTEMFPRKNVPYQNVPGKNVHHTKMSPAKKFPTKMSPAKMSPIPKCPQAKMSLDQMFFRPKCPPIQNIQSII